MTKKDSGAAVSDHQMTQHYMPWLLLYVQSIYTGEITVRRISWGVFVLIFSAFFCVCVRESQDYDYLVKWVAKAGFSSCADVWDFNPTPQPGLQPAYSINSIGQDLYLWRALSQGREITLGIERLISRSELVLKWPGMKRSLFNLAATVVLCSNIWNFQLRGSRCKILIQDLKAIATYL